MYKTGYFEERPGVKSSIRVNTFILLLFTMAFDVFLVLTPGFIITYNFVLLNLVFLTAIFAPKYLSKIIESKATLADIDKQPPEKNSDGQMGKQIDLDAPA